MDRTYPEIPVFQNCVLALRIDIKKQVEQILLGEFGEVRRTVNGSDSAAAVINTERPIGSLVIDCCHPMALTISNIRASLCIGDTQDPTLWNQSMNELNQLYKSDNPCFKFFALRIWQEYIFRKEKSKAHSLIRSNEKKPFSHLIDFIENLTLPVRFSLESLVKEAQSCFDKTPLENFDNTLLDGTANFFFAHTKEFQEYIVADTDLMPLVVYSLKAIYGNHQYFQRCKVCNKLFLAHTANIPTLCSNECRRTQSRLNKQKYDHIKKNISYEKDYKNSYMYWYNKLEKLKDLKKVDYQPYEKAFQAFCMDARIKKHAVKDGSLSVSGYNNWLLYQRTKADEIMSLILEGQSQKAKQNPGQTF